MKNPAAILHLITGLALIVMGVIIWVKPPNLKFFQDSSYARPLVSIIIFIYGLLRIYLGIRKINGKKGYFD